MMAAASDRTGKQQQRHLHLYDPASLLWFQNACWPADDKRSQYHRCAIPKHMSPFFFFRFLLISSQANRFSYLQTDRRAEKAVLLENLRSLLRTSFSFLFFFISYFLLGSSFWLWRTNSCPFFRSCNWFPLFLFLSLFFFATSSWIFHSSWL